MKRSTFISLGILQCFVAAGALPSGYLFITHPDGSGLGMTLEALQDSPFPDYLIPGLFLFLIIGCLHLFAAMASFRQRGLTGKAGLALGAVLALWIILQVFFIGLTAWLQPAFFVVGLVEMGLGYQVLKAGKTITKP